MIRIAKFLSFLLVAIVCGCSNEREQGNQFDMVSALPVMEGAYNLRHSFGSEAYQQLSYDIRKDFPSKEALDFYDQYFNENGWIKCIGDMEKWGSYIDATHEIEKKVYRVAHYFIKKSESKFGIVLLHYTTSQKIYDKEPDNNEQKVYVVMERGPHVEIKSLILSLTCNNNYPLEQNDK
jgi:hypothetical protein